MMTYFQTLNLLEWIYPETNKAEVLGSLLICICPVQGLGATLSSVFIIFFCLLNRILPQWYKLQVLQELNPSPLPSSDFLYLNHILQWPLQKLAAASTFIEVALPWPKHSSFSNFLFRVPKNQIFNPTVILVFINY